MPVFNQDPKIREVAKITDTDEGKVLTAKDGEAVWEEATGTEVLVLDDINDLPADTKDGTFVVVPSEESEEEESGDGSINITWDGNTDGLTSVNIGTPMYLVSDRVLTADELSGATVTINTDGESASGPIEAANVVTMFDGVVLWQSETAIMSAVAGTYDGIEIPASGTYFARGEGTATVYIESLVKEVESKTKKLYNYNGVELPALPEWDKTTYPYAAITTTAPVNSDLFSTDYVYCIFSTVPLYQYLDFYGGYLNNLKSKAAGQAIVYQSDGESFQPYVNLGEIFTFEAGDYVPENLTASCVAIWANYDVLKDSDGTTLYLATSYPTDAETGEEIHDYEVKPVPTTPIPSDAYIVKGGKLYKVKGGSAPTILTFDSVDEMNAFNAPDGTIALVPSEGESGGGLPTIELSQSITAGTEVTLTEEESAFFNSAMANKTPVIVKMTLIVEEMGEMPFALLCNLFGGMYFTYQDALLTLQIMNGDGAWIVSSTLNG